MNYVDSSLAEFTEDVRLPTDSCLGSFRPCVSSMAKPKKRAALALVCYQSQVEINHKAYLVRVRVNEGSAKVVTVYRTSKIGKYWRTTA